VVDARVLVRREVTILPDLPGIERVLVGTRDEGAPGAASSRYTGAFGSVCHRRSAGTDAPPSRPRSRAVPDGEGIATEEVR